MEGVCVLNNHIIEVDVCNHLRGYTVVPHNLSLHLLGKDAADVEAKGKDNKGGDAEAGTAMLA